FATPFFNGDKSFRRMHFTILAIHKHLLPIGLAPTKAPLAAGAEVNLAHRHGPAIGPEKPLRQVPWLRPRFPREFSRCIQVLSDDQLPIGEDRERWGMSL